MAEVLIGTPVRLDLPFYTGSTFSRSFRLQNPDRTPIDLTGYTARMQVRASKNSSTVLLEFTETNGRIFIEHVDGRITISVNSDDSDLVTVGGVYDLEIVLPQPPDPDFVQRLAEGKFIVSRQATR